MAKLPEPLDSLAPNPWTEDMPLMFGKFKGMTVDQVMDEQPSYLVWAHENVKFFRLTEALYVQAQRKAAQAQRQRAEALRDRYINERSASCTVGVFDLEREVRHMMSGVFGVHMNDMDVFLENMEYNHLDDEGDWTNQRPY